MWIKPGLSDTHTHFSWSASPHHQIASSLQLLFSCLSIHVYPFQYKQLREQLWMQVLWWHYLWRWNMQLTHAGCLTPKQSWSFQLSENPHLFQSELLSSKCHLSLTSIYTFFLNNYVWEYIVTIFLITIGKSKSTLWMRFWVYLVSMKRNESGIWKGLFHFILFN
jgi:hypothetical protein